MYNTQNNAGRKWHGFDIDIEIGLVALCVVKRDLLSVWGVGIDLSSVYGLVLTWFGVGVENDRV